MILMPWNIVLMCFLDRTNSAPHPEALPDCTLPWTHVGRIQVFCIIFVDDCLCKYGMKIPGYAIEIYHHKTHTSNLLPLL